MIRTVMKNFLRYSFLGKLILYLYYRAQSARQRTGANVMFGSVVNRSILGRSVTIFQNCNVSHSELGDYSYLAEGGCIGRTRIGKYSCIGPNFLTGLGMHPTRGFVSSHPVFYSSTPPTGPVLTEVGLFSEKAAITLGNDVWIGANVVVLDGVTIGDGAIIGAGAVVNRDIPPYAVAVGVPCKIVRFRFAEKKIRQLLQLKWWDQSDKWIAANAHRFTSAEKIQE